jgi:hypothetical protein
MSPFVLCLEIGTSRAGAWTSRCAQRSLQADVLQASFVLAHGKWGEGYLYSVIVVVSREEQPASYERHSLEAQV